VVSQHEQIVLLRTRCGARRIWVTPWVGRRDTIDIALEVSGYHLGDRRDLDAAPEKRTFRWLRRAELDNIRVDIYQEV